MIDRAIVDEEIHPESEFENQFTPVEVTAETFPALKNSLYTEAPDVDISSAQNQVSYKLYNDDGELLQTETVPVLRDGQKGDAGTDGADGEQGGGYLGPFAANPANPVTNDFYLDTTEQTVYYFDGENWIEDELDEDAPLSWRWNAAIQDCISLATGSGNFVKASNIWVDKITANTVIAEKIKASAGFFDSIEVTGDSLFNGDLVTNSIHKRDFGYITFSYPATSPFTSLYLTGYSDNIEYVHWKSKGVFEIGIKDIDPDYWFFPSFSSVIVEGYIDKVSAYTTVYYSKSNKIGFAAFVTPGYEIQPKQTLYVQTFPESKTSGGFTGAKATKDSSYTSKNVYKINLMVFDFEGNLVNPAECSVVISGLRLDNFSPSGSTLPIKIM